MFCRFKATIGKGFLCLLTDSIIALASLIVSWSSDAWDSARESSCSVAESSAGVGDLRLAFVVVATPFDVVGWRGMSLTSLCASLALIECYRE